jgi:lipopolysaccharide export system permease protein
MRRIHRMILRMLPGPMLAWLSMLMFLLVMQFLIKYLPDLVGKGLPISVIGELVVYNLAYMLVLAVPMSVLIAALITFGKLVETNSFSVIKSAGVSFPQLVWPALLVGLALTLVMTYFNNEILPEANFRARNLWQDIRVAKPGFDLKPGTFYDGIDQYRILVQNIPESDPDDLEGVTIYDYTAGARFRTDITAERGRLQTINDGQTLEILLFDGEIHRRRPPGSGDKDRYEKLSFSRHRLQISLDDLTFERTDPESGRRTDRTMRTSVMSHMVDSLEAIVSSEEAVLADALSTLGRGAADQTRSDILLPEVKETARSRTPGSARIVSSVLPGKETDARSKLYDITLLRARADRFRIDTARRSISWAEQTVARYRVEIHKKRSIALACLIFMLIGAPLGLSIRRGSLGIAASLAIGIFLFYWVTLVNGEKLADRGLLTPWVGMWAGNIVTGLLGLFLATYVTLDWRATGRRYLRRRTNRSDSSLMGSPGTGESIHV